MIDELLALLLTALLLAYATVRRPTRARCPDGWMLSEGIRTQPLHGHPAGSYACQRPPIGGDRDVLTGGSTAIEQPGVIRSRIYCTGGASPIVVNNRTVGCQRQRGPTS